MTPNDPDKPQRKRPRKRTKPKKTQKRTYNQEFGKLPRDDRNELLEFLEWILRGWSSFWEHF